MSIAEILDHGTPHPWANLRINNLVVDGTTSGGGVSGSLNAIYSGPFAAPINFPVDYSKNGKTVTLTIHQAQDVPNGGVAGPILSDAGTIPAFLLPNFYGALTNINFPVKVVNNGVIPTAPGLLTITPTGRINIFLDLNNTSFGTTGLRGFFSISVSYVTA